MSKQEIINKRMGGLGSSDAKMVAKITRNGCLSDSDNQRIAIMLGLEQKREFKSLPTEYGNFIEERIFEIIKKKYPNAISNPYYKSEELSEKYGFDIFNHIDYEVETDDKLIWIENKATKKCAAETFEEYKYQICWHENLLIEKAMAVRKMPILLMSHYKVDEYGDFIAENLTIKEIPHINCDFSKGFEIISEAIKDFQYEPKEELYADNLPVSIQEKMQQMAVCLREIKEAENKVEQFKERMKEMMLENNVKSIDNDFFRISLVGESFSSSFDKKTFEKEHPDLAKQFTKQIKKQSYITLKIK